MDLVQIRLAKTPNILSPKGFFPFVKPFSM